jgi:lipopolysaccharide/colanic/teichoic acid biosynthesis glycosyltransferase
MLAQHLTPPPRSTADYPVPKHLKRARRSERLKRLFDLLVAVAFTLPALPIIALAWLFVRLTSSGPGFYSQVRVGLNGKQYRIYKLRTMYHNCEAKSGAAWCTKSDPRVTSVGRVLRKLHIDELPQLLNVLRGDMSIVGPRPERPEFVGPLSEKIVDYRDRLAVRPGVTGLAQIQLPPDTDLESVRKKIVLDQCYIRQGGLWLDIRIIAGTAVYLCGCSYSTVRTLMRLPAARDDRPASLSPGSRPAPSSNKLDRNETDKDKCRAVARDPIPCGERQ